MSEKLSPEELTCATRRILDLTRRFGVRGAKVEPEVLGYAVHLNFKSGVQLASITEAVATATGMAICAIPSVEVSSLGGVYAVAEGVTAEYLRDVREWGR